VVGWDEGWLVGAAVGAGTSKYAFPTESPAKPILLEYIFNAYTPTPLFETNEVVADQLIPPLVVWNIAPFKPPIHPNESVRSEIECGGRNEDVVPEENKFN